MFPFLVPGTSQIVNPLLATCLSIKLCTARYAAAIYAHKTYIIYNWHDHHISSMSNDELLVIINLHRG